MQTAKGAGAAGSSATWLTDDWEVEAAGGRDAVGSGAAKARPAGALGPRHDSVNELDNRMAPRPDVSLDTH